MKAILFTTLCLAFSAAQIQVPNVPPPKEYKVPPEEIKRENPVKATPSSIAEGKRTYATQCVMCHGENGDGKGDLAGALELKLRDYRDPAALKDMTDGEMFYILTIGKGKMPGQEERMKAEQKWNLINFIRSLSKKELAGAESPSKKEDKPEPKAGQKPPR